MARNSSRQETLRKDYPALVHVPLKTVQIMRPSVSGGNVPALDHKYETCKRGAYPTQLLFQELTDLACEKITVTMESYRISGMNNLGTHGRPAFAE